MNTDQNFQEPLRLSSKLSTLSMIVSPPFGVLIALMIVDKTFYAWWGILVAIGLLVFTFYFPYLTYNVFFKDGGLVVQRFWGTSRLVQMENILKIKCIKLKRSEYYFVTCADFKFIIISPYWGRGRLALENLYLKLNSK